jgi:hypothetical protein
MICGSRRKHLDSTPKIHFNTTTCSDSSNETSENAPTPICDRPIQHLKASAANPHHAG